MSNLENRRIFLIEGGTARRLIDEFIEADLRRRQAFFEILKEYAASDVLQTTEGHFAGLRFENEPNTESAAARALRKDEKQNRWVPNRRTREGKELEQRAHKIAKKNYDHYLYKFILKGDTWCIGVHNGRTVMQVPDFWMNAKKWFFSYPDEADGIELVDGLRELKLSEYYALIGE